MKHADKNTYFRNIHLFITRAKEMTITKDDQVVRDNLWMSFRDIALKWWIDELSNIERRMTRMTFIEADDLSEWTTLLLSRFKESSNVAMQSLITQKYTLRDATNRRELKEYAQ